MVPKTYQTATHGYDAKTYEQAAQMKVVARALADGDGELIKGFVENGVINLKEGLVDKLNE